MPVVRAYGWRPSPPDPRDRKMSLAHPGAVALPPAVDMRQFCKIVDQGGTQTCVANAATQALTAQIWLQTGVKPPDMSRLFTYANCKIVSKQPITKDDGTFVRAAYAGFHQFGFCEEFAWPWVEENATTTPPWGAYTLARDRRWLEGYESIPDFGNPRVQACKLALAQGHYVVFGTSVDNAFETLRPGQVWPGVKGSVLGGHAMYLAGYTQDYFWGVNSWSTGWGESGFWRCSYDAIGSLDADDFWVGKLAPVV